MAKSARTRQKPKQTPTKIEGLQIQRDSTFVRIAADDTIVMNKNDAVHIALLAAGPDPVFQSNPMYVGESIGNQQVQLAGSLAELARIRLPAAEAFSMAMQIVEHSLSSGRIKVDAFRIALDAMLAEYADKEIDIQISRPNPTGEP